MKEKFSKWYLRPNWIFKAFALLFSICFCASFAIDMSCYMKKPYQACEEDFVKDQKDYIKLEKRWNLYFNDDEANDFAKNTNTNFIKCYPMRIYLTDSYSSLYNDIFPRIYDDCISVSSLKSLPRSYKVIEGKLPEGEKEIMLTDFQYCFFKYNSYSYDGETILPENMSMKSLVGKTIESRFSSIGKVTISGILGTGFDYEHSDEFIKTYQKEEYDSLLMNKLLDKYIVSDKLIKPIIDNNNLFYYKTDNDLSVGSNVILSNSKIGETDSSSYITLLNDHSLDRALRLNENVEDEVLLPVSYFSSMLYNNYETEMTVIIPKEFVYGASDDLEKKMKLPDLFDDYLEYAVSYYADENYAEIYSNELPFMKDYGKYYFRTENLKLVDEWTDEEKKGVLKLYLLYNYRYSYSDEYFSEDANTFIVSYSKKYLKHFYDKYENEIFQGDKTILIGERKKEIYPFTFNGFNLHKQEFGAGRNDSILVNEKGLKKLSIFAGNYYTSLIARTEDADIDAVFSYVYGKKNKLPGYNGYRYDVVNTKYSFYRYKGFIENKREIVNKILILSAVLTLTFIILDVFFIKRKNERKIYLIASGENAKEECLKTAMFPSILSMILTWPLSIVVSACCMPILNKNSMVYIPFYPINVLYLFLASLVVSAISFLLLFIILENKRRVHEEAMRIKEKQKNK